MKLRWLDITKYRSHVLAVQKWMEPESRKMIEEQPGNGPLGIDATMINEDITGWSFEGLDMVAVVQDFTNQVLGCRC
ncbi:hypothetical protein D5086_022229 [Populus alba]|uniref:Uncharacterized protein n=1 Tax=Populus alba TaxID=43335 RepID=A0ACC4BEY0_POPAL